MGLSQYSTEGIVSVLYHHCTDSGVFQALPHLPFSVNVAGTFKAYNRNLVFTLQATLDRNVNYNKAKFYIIGTVQRL
jgi:hypothetical protein